MQETIENDKGTIRIDDEELLTRDLVLDLKNQDWSQFAISIKTLLAKVTSDFEELRFDSEPDIKRAQVLKMYSDHLNKTIRLISDLRLTESRLPLKSEDVQSRFKDQLKDLQSQFISQFR